MARAFDELGFQTVSARAMPDNAASRRVMEKVGLRYDSEFEFPARLLPGLVIPAVRGVLYKAERGGR